ncbi:prepilin peptidase [Halobacillus fulvus]|nr:prepilin peptidase [Halobacillus fulvus]
MPILLLSVLLIISVYTDIKERKIFNKVTLPTILIALVYSTITAGLSGAWFSLSGMLVGFGLLIIPFILGGMGAGDVKLMAAIGALMGASFAFYTFIWGAIIGGVVSLFLIIRRKRMGAFTKRLVYSWVLLRSNAGSLAIDNGEVTPTIPYGVAIALGAVVTLIMGAI